MSEPVLTEAQRTAREVVANEARAVAAVADQIVASFDTTVELLLGCSGKVITSGAGTSGSVARRLAHLLSVSGTPALFLSAADSLHGSLGAVTADDVVIAISKGGSSEELNEFTRRAAVRGARIIALTAQPESELAKAADHLVVITTPEGADPGEAIAMGSTLAMSSWGDALAVVLMRVKRYSWSDVLFTHPSGHVGRMTEEPEALAPLVVGTGDRVDGLAPGDNES
jgi:arabinose-5-phosphate isomerase